MRKLKHCPFCDGQPDLNMIGDYLGDGTGWFVNGDWLGIVRCQKCGVSIEFRGKKANLYQIALQKWNRRVNPAFSTRTKARRRRKASYPKSRRP